MASGAESEWSERVARWKTSGLSTRELAAAEGVNASSLAWWKWKLGKGAPSRPKKKRAKASSSEVEPLAFVQLRAPSSGRPVEVVLASGQVLRVPPGADVGLVASLASALERQAR